MRSLTLKLGVAFLLVSVTGALLAAVIIHTTIQQDFNHVVLDRAETEFVTLMQNYYQLHGSWAGLSELHTPVAQQQLAAPAFVVLDQRGFVVLPGQHAPLGSFIAPATRTNAKSIMLAGQVIGTVLTNGTTPPLNPIEESYLRDTDRALGLSELVVVAVAISLGFFLARTLTRPIRELTGALHAMTAGDLHQAVPVRSRDEVGELATTFNRMSVELVAANHQRRQMTADIAHDLRTPVTVMVGYLESMLDGILSPSQERITVLYSEAVHLQRLIEDLRTLSLADAGELALAYDDVTPAILLERIIASFAHQAETQQITLEAQSDPDIPEIALDEDRIVQVLGNIVSNALRYTPAGGTITLRASADRDQLTFAVHDTGKGIAPEALPHIFDRFYRADAARSQTNGGSGLGLAIARALVEAHMGAITVKSTVGHGTTFTIALPRGTVAPET